MVRIMARRDTRDTHAHTHKGASMPPASLVLLGLLCWPAWLVLFSPSFLHEWPIISYIRQSWCLVEAVMRMLIFFNSYGDMVEELSNVRMAQ